MVSVITVMQFTSVLSAICSVYAAILALNISDHSVSHIAEDAAQDQNTLKYRGVAYTRFPKVK